MSNAESTSRTLGAHPQHPPPLPDAAVLAGSSVLGACVNTAGQRPSCPLRGPCPLLLTSLPWLSRPGLVVRAAVLLFVHLPGNKVPPPQAPASLGSVWCSPTSQLPPSAVREQAPYLKNVVPR